MLRGKMQTLIAAGIVSTVIGFAPHSARAENPYLNIPEQERLTREAQKLWWASLTPRQKELVHAVNKEEKLHQRQTGEPCIELTQQNLQILMKRIGAKANEADFVYERMAYAKSVAQALHQADDQIARENQRQDCISRGGGLACWR